MISPLCLGMVIWSPKTTEISVFLKAQSQVRQLLANERPFKIMKNAFYFTLKLFSFSRYVNHFEFWSCRKTAKFKRLISKFITSQPDYQTIAINILPNISRSKDNKAMKFGKSNMSNTFREKSYTKSGGETIPRPFLKNSKLSISQDEESKVLCSLFLLFAKLRAIKIY